ncbi:hypothetical protein C8N43_2930 [Litoreibacter ponti]|uniref:DoxX-like protein n=1 Tax=Litoreibacter ponti TaxID=1510457 RepID=A0A2T6BDL6_9RHOB|nr:hypothetical protein [Litoreibacter ponti]PTX54124.1 hypothetical protein C8N43_2930 [Litoreibacter ponti]
MSGLTAYRRILAIAFLMIGLISIFAPARFASLYGLDFASPVGAASLAAILGGGELAIGLALAAPRYVGLTETGIIRFVALLLACVAATRLLWLAVFGVWSVGILAELALELIVIGLAIWLLRGRTVPA